MLLAGGSPATISGGQALLAAAYAHRQEQAARIADKDIRRTFPENRELVAAFAPSDAAEHWGE